MSDVNSTASSDSDIDFVELFLRQPCPEEPLGNMSGGRSSALSDEDFMENQEAPLKRRKLDLETESGQQDELVEEGANRRGRGEEYDEPDLETASKREIEDIEKVLDIKMEIGLISSHLGDSDGGRGKGKSRKQQECEKILGQLRMINEYVKRKESIQEMFEVRLSPEIPAHHMRTVFMVLRAKRRMGEKLPVVEDVASYLFYQKKVMATTAWQHKKQEVFFSTPSVLKL